MSFNFWMFPGQGSQYVGMGKDWFQNFKSAKLAFEEASDGAGINLTKLCFDSSESELRSTEITQPALLTVTTAIFRSLSELSEKFLISKGDTFGGHSLGEYSALVCAGVLSLGETAKIVRLRGKFMQEAVPEGEGAMVALLFKPKVAGTPLLAEKFCQEIKSQTGAYISVANFNSPEQIVVAGERAALEVAIQVAQKKEEYQIRRALELPVSAPFHTELMKSAAARLSENLASLRINNKPGLNYVSNVDAELYELGRAVESQIPERFEKQITSSVRWIECVQKVSSLGPSQVYEVGPGQVLSGLYKRIMPETSVFSLSIDRLEQLQTKLKENNGHTV